MRLITIETRYSSLWILDGAYRAKRGLSFGAARCILFGEMLERFQDVRPIMKIRPFLDNVNRAIFLKIRRMLPGVHITQRELDGQRADLGVARNETKATSMRNLWALRCSRTRNNAISSHSDGMRHCRSKMGLAILKAHKNLQDSMNA